MSLMDYSSGSVKEYVCLDKNISIEGTKHLSIKYNPEDDNNKKNFNYSFQIITNNNISFSYSFYGNKTKNTLTVFDLAGRVVFSRDISNKNIKISNWDNNSIVSKVYIARLTSIDINGQKSEYKKIFTVVK